MRARTLTLCRLSTAKSAVVSLKLLHPLPVLFNVLEANQVCPPSVDTSTYTGSVRLLFPDMRHENFRFL